jgi:1-deoxy-D-xylulose-5-phosphate synthase
MLERHPLLLTVEEHATAGGFGSAVLEHVATLASPPPCVVRVVAVPDRLVLHGESRDWIERLGLDAASIAERARSELRALAQV